MAKKIKSTLQPKKLKLLFVTSEYEGLVKSGGLGDVSRSLSNALTKRGHEVVVVMPYYHQLISAKTELVFEGLYVKPGSNELGFSVYKLISADVTLYLIENHHYFDRPRLYDDGAVEYGDNPERFCLLSAAALKLAEVLEFYPDWVHCNDWQTALVPLYIRRLAERDKNFAATRSLLTIHNGFFQGRYSAYFQGFLGLGLSFNYREFEEYGYINLLKGGIELADFVNTVSPGYASELLSAEGGHGLATKYQTKSTKFKGILNGCDTENWNPRTDLFIAANYGSKTIELKQNCKQDLMREFGLGYMSNRPVIGIVSRLTEQKGFYYTIPALLGLLKHDITVVALGTGDLPIVNGMFYLKQLYPERFGWHLGYSDLLAHKIEAGSDFFLMPSLFEPCGLNQMYSQIYGTLPIVRSVGGLRDTVENCDEVKKTGTGFVFETPSSEALYNTVLWAIEVFNNNKDQFSTMQKTAMNKDYSWDNAVKIYENLYNNKNI